jgi:hypothetical protein
MDKTLSVNISKVHFKLSAPEPRQIRLTNLRLADFLERVAVRAAALNARAKSARNPPRRAAFAQGIGNFINEIEFLEWHSPCEGFNPRYLRIALVCGLAELNQTTKTNCERIKFDESKANIDNLWGCRRSRHERRQPSSATR